MNEPLTASNPPEEASALLSSQPEKSSYCKDGNTVCGQHMRRGLIPSCAAMLLALLASQHHTIMMLLLGFGLSGAAMSFMAAVPVVRDIMLGMSLLMIGVIAWQIRDSRRPHTMRLVGAISIVATAGLSAWSIVRFGL